MLAFTGPDVLVTYERSGGFAGIQEKVTVNSSGTALVNDRPVPLDDTEMRGLRRALGRIVTTRSSSAGCDIADRFTFTLDHRGRRATRCALPCDWRAAVERLEALTGRPVVLPERLETLAGR